VISTMVERRTTSKPDRGLVVQRVEVRDQHGVTVQTGELVVLIATSSEPFSRTSR
jgi:acyl dehydratase